MHSIFHLRPASARHASRSIARSARLPSQTCTATGYSRYPIYYAAISCNAIRLSSTSVSYQRSSRRLYQTSSLPDRTRDAVIHALSSISSKKEANQWLAQFQNVDPTRFAVIKVGGAILEEHMQTLCIALEHLYRLNLIPTVCCGGGYQLNKMLEDAGVEPQYSDGIRITDPKTLTIARKLFLQENLKLVETLESMGVRARPITSGVYTADYLDFERYQYVGKITNVDVQPIQQAVHDGCIPVLTCMAESNESQVLNINADVAAGELARALQPLKIVYLSEKGGLYNGDTNEKISSIELDEEYQGLLEQWWVKRGTLLKIKEIKELLDKLPRSSSVAIIHPENLEKELFTDSGAGTLVRRGLKVQVASSVAEFPDLNQLKKILLRDREGLDAGAVVDRYIETLKTRPFKAYFDENMDALAIVLPSLDGSSMATLSTFAVSRAGWLSNVADNIFNTHLRTDFPQLVWTVRRDDENLVWFYERSDGSIVREAEVLFWYGLQSVDEVRELHLLFAEKGRRMMGDTNLETHLAAADAAARTRIGAQQRAYSTTSKFASNRPRIHSNRISSNSFTFRRSYATNPNPPFGIKHASNEVPSKVALIGARGYTGKALVEILDRHPNFDLRHVSSRELAGQHLQGYTKRDIIYENLGPDEIRKMAENGEIDCWIMALPNGVSKPYVDAIDESRTDALVIDLSADYRFDPEWTYGLPELVKRPKIAQSIRISNPGCYATAAQIGIAPLLERLGGQPTVFGVSGYSGAGTKPSPKNDVQNLTDNLIAYSLTDHVHEREISSQLGTNVAFIPHVAVWFQGIHHSISIPLATPSTSREIRNIFADRYAGEPLIKITGEPPQVKNIAKSHGIEVGGFQVSNDGTRVVVCATIDNLMKGAATQCIQNMNLALAYPEFEGIHE